MAVTGANMAVPFIGYPPRVYLFRLTQYVLHYREGCTQVSQPTASKHLNHTVNSFALIPCLPSNFLIIIWLSV